METLLRAFFIITCFTLTPAFAHELDPASEEALGKTQELLATPKLREKAIKDSPNAQMVDAQVRALAGNDATTEDIYQLSNQIFNDMVKETGGDVLKMQEMLKKAKDDPKSFAEHLSAKNKEALHKLSNQITNSSTTSRDSAPAKK